MFAWDVRKAQLNYDKHGVAFEEVATVFADPAGLDWDDLVHSREERRHKRLGRSGAGRILLVVYTVRRKPHDQETIRIISACQASRKERQAYAG
jgi:uncharacterized DUF497 family protein